MGWPRWVLVPTARRRAQPTVQPLRPSQHSDLEAALELSGMHHPVALSSQCARAALLAQLSRRTFLCTGGVCSTCMRVSLIVRATIFAGLQRQGRGKK